MSVTPCQKLREFLNHLAELETLLEKQNFIRDFILSLLHTVWPGYPPLPGGEEGIDGLTLEDIDAWVVKLRSDTEGPCYIDIHV